MYSSRRLDSKEASDDAAEWRFRIRQGVTFHNGKDLTPEDVAQTIRRHTDENTQSAAFGVLTDIQEVAVDGQDVVFRLARGNADLPLLLTDYHLVIQPNGGFDGPDAGPVREFFTGSVGARLAHRQHRPILIVPLGEPVPDDEEIWPA